MLALSSYYLSPENNARIETALAERGWRFIPSSTDDSDERIALLERHIAEADVLLGGRLSEEQWARAERLRWIHVPWAGVNSLLATTAIRESDILITNSSGVMSDSVADQVMAYVLMFNRDLHRQIRVGLRREWNRYALESPRRQIARGKTLGLIGYGAIGEAVARRARAFGMRVIATRRRADQPAPELDVVYGPDGLHALLAESDYVVLALPLTEETRGSIGAGEFAVMKPGASFINIARGAIVRQEELIEALRSGAIAGAALDVFETEPLPSDSPLWEMENVIVTPHSAGGYLGFGDAVVDLFLDNLDRWASGAPMRNVVRQKEGY